MNMKTIKLYNGVEIPQIGYGAILRICISRYRIFLMGI